MPSQRVRDIKEEDISEVIEIRVIRKWISKAKKEDLCYQFIDIYGDCIEATADIKHIEQFDSVIQLNSCYRVTEYICTKPHAYMATVNHPASLVIGQKAKFQRITNDAIPTIYFDFATYDIIKERIREPKLLTDYIGRVEKNYLRSTTKRMQLRKTLLQDEMKREVEITIWPDMSHLIGDEVIPGDILAITSAMVTEHNGHLQLESTYLTTVLRNPDLPETIEHVKRLKALPPMQPTQKIEDMVTLLDLKLASQQKIQTAKNFTCKARVTNIHDNCSWYYVVCSKCSQKLYPQQGKSGRIYVCKDDDDIIPNFKYCVNATITDATGSVDTVFFNESMEAMVHVSCEDMVTKHAQSSNTKDVPQLLQTIIDKPKLLHLNLKNDGQIVVNNVTDVTESSHIKTPSKEGTTSTFTPNTPLPKTYASKRQLLETEDSGKKQKHA